MFDAETHANAVVIAAGYAATAEALAQRAVTMDALAEVLRDSPEFREMHRCCLGPLRELSRRLAVYKSAAGRLARTIEAETPDPREPQ